MQKILILLVSVLVILSCNTQNKKDDSKNIAVLDSTIMFREETHFKNLRQLTFGGDNAEAYWSFDDKKLTFQATNRKWGDSCDQIFYTTWETSDLRNQVPTLLSTGKGRTTCSYFLPGDSLILYGSTHLGGDACPPKPAQRTDGKYVWPIYSTFDIFIARLDGKIVKQLTNTPGYDAEATVSPKGDKIVFTSLRSGDPELYTMNLDGSDVKQVTNILGYDGGAFFSHDGKKLIFRASRPQTPEDIKVYKDLLKEGLVMPTKMELFTCNIDGTDLRQITKLGGANWCPYFHPSDQKIIFASNYESKRGFPFNLYLINIDGTGLERITRDGVFDAFPVFSNNGKYLVFSSNRNNGGTHDTNLFVAEWAD
jgi:TolB protein